MTRHLAIPSPVAGNAPYRVKYLSVDSPETGYEEESLRVEENQIKGHWLKKKRNYSAQMNGETPHYQRPKVQPLPPRVRPHVSGPAGWGKPAGGTPDPAVPVSLTALVGRVPPHCRQDKTRLTEKQAGKDATPPLPQHGRKPPLPRRSPIRQCKARAVLDATPAPAQVRPETRSQLI
ncbi:hypothetical protein J6590_076250 [Homalodisca vitripennis]|nr:hypothetical protein J6590_076250 [Homalodisca vitripennis]